MPDAYEYAISYGGHEVTWQADETPEGLEDLQNKLRGRPAPSTMTGLVAALPRSRRADRGERLVDARGTATSRARSGPRRPAACGCGSPRSPSRTRGAR